MQEYNYSKTVTRAEPIASLVNIMDSIMYDAQRHGRVSFYMVGLQRQKL